MKILLFGAIRIKLKPIEGIFVLSYRGSDIFKEWSLKKGPVKTSTGGVSRPRKRRVVDNAMGRELKSEGDRKMKWRGRAGNL